MFQRRANSSGLESADTQQLLNRDTFDVGGIGFLRRWEQDSKYHSCSVGFLVVGHLLASADTIKAAETHQSPPRETQAAPASFHSNLLRWGWAQEKLLKEVLVSSGEMSASLCTSNNLGDSGGAFFLWEDAEIPRELKPKDINLIYPPKSARLSWKFSRVNICQMFPGLMSCQSKPLWLQPPQAGPALFLPLVKIVATDKTQKQCWESRNFKF